MTSKPNTYVAVYRGPSDEVAGETVVATVDQGLAASSIPLSRAKSRAAWPWNTAGTRMLGPNSTTVLTAGSSPGAPFARAGIAEKDNIPSARTIRTANLVDDRMAGSFRLVVCSLTRRRQGRFPGSSF